MTGTIEKNNAVKLNKGEAGVLYFYKGWSGNRLGGIWATKETRMSWLYLEEFQVDMNAFGGKNTYPKKKKKIMWQMSS